MDIFQLKELVSEGKSMFEIPLRVVYYARVSTEKDEQLNSLENQIYYYEEYIRKNKNWTFGGRYVDEGISGTTVEKRSSFLKMIEDARDSKFDLIVTKEISRFSRNTLDSIKYTQKLLKYGVGVYFQSDNINTLLPDSELRLTIMASIAQEEVRKLSERLRFGYKRSMEKGKVLGQDNTLGYDKRDGILTINDNEAEIVKKIFSLYNEGKLGIRRIAKELESIGMVSPYTGKMLCPDTIKNVIQNPKYKGYYCAKKTVSLDYRNKKRVKLPSDQWIVYKDEKIPAIVSEDVWEKANKLYAERGKKMSKDKQAYQSRYSFSGKIICGEHGTTYHRHVYKSKSKGEQEVWNCKLYRLKGKQYGCDSPTLYTSELNLILNDIYKKIYNKKPLVIDKLMEIYCSENSVDFKKKIQSKNKELDLIKRKKDKLLELSIENLITKAEFSERNDSLNKQADKILAEIEIYNDEMRILQSAENNISELRESLESEFVFDGSFCDELSNVFLDRIVVHKLEQSKLKLQIILKIGKTFEKLKSISVDEIGISQAQVSRLEKSAIKHMKKYM